MATSRKRTFSDLFNVYVIQEGWQVLRTYPIADNSSVRFEIVLNARQSDGAQRGIFKRVGCFFRHGGGPVQVQGKFWQTNETRKSHPEMDVRYVLSPTSIVIQVKNASIVPTYWVGYVNMLINKG